MPQRPRLAADIGGTFTDLVLTDAGARPWTLKLPSTPDDYSRAIAEGAAVLLARAGLPGEALAEVLHGTTIASNTILEGKGARTGLITTRGFRDILELRTLRMPRLYDLTWEKPPVLIPRRLRTEVTERLDHQGRIQIPLDEASVLAAIDHLLAEGVASIAVCLLHAYANDIHERRIAELVRARAPKIALSLSADVLPEIREYERTSTTVINAYVQPVVGRYLGRLMAALEQQRVGAQLLLMQSSGGLMPAEDAARLPVHIVESGPAAGVVGAMALARRLEQPDLISFDMGGTTAKAALVERGAASRAAELQVGGGIMSGSRLLTGAGYTLRLPAIDLAEVGAGGGSIVWLDRAGQPQVGPESAGAVPGPACYGTGGTRPTITDCALVLGYLNPEMLAGGAVRLDPALAREAIEQQVAAPMGLSVERAAHGAIQVAVSTMIRAIRAVSSERGRDPRGFTLVAFGGNGGLFGPLVAESLGLTRVIVPPAPGLFSAMGLLDGAVEHHFSRTLKAPLRTMDLDLVNDHLAAMERMAAIRLGNDPEAIDVTRLARMRYYGQSFELAVPLPPGLLTDQHRPVLEDLFGHEHERVYGHRAGPEEPVENIGLQLVARRPCRERCLHRRAAPSAGTGGSGTRLAYLGPRLRWQTLPLLSRAELAAPRPGPFLIEEYDCTILVPAMARAHADDALNLVIEL